MISRSFRAGARAGTIAIFDPLYQAGYQSSERFSSSDINFPANGQRQTTLREGALSIRGPIGFGPSFARARRAFYADACEWLVSTTRTLTCKIAACSNACYLSFICLSHQAWILPAAEGKHILKPFGLE